MCLIKEKSTNKSSEKKRSMIKDEIGDLNYNYLWGTTSQTDMRVSRMNFRRSYIDIKVIWVRFGKRVVYFQSQLIFCEEPHSSIFFIHPVETNPSIGNIDRGMFYIKFPCIIQLPQVYVWQL